MGQIRDKEGYERLRAFVDEVVEATINDNGWGWLDHATLPAERELHVHEIRELIRQERRADPECEGLSARKRWLRLAYDECMELWSEKRAAEEGYDDIEGA